MRYKEKMTATVPSGLETKAAAVRTSLDAWVRDETRVDRNRLVRVQAAEPGPTIDDERAHGRPVSGCGERDRRGAKGR